MFGYIDPYFFHHPYRMRMDEAGRLRSGAFDSEPFAELGFENAFGKVGAA